jgi:hypothetical protein
MAAGWPLADLASGVLNGNFIQRAGFQHASFRGSRWRIWSRRPAVFISTMGMWPLTLPFRSIERESRPGVWMKSAPRSHRNHRRMPRSNCSDLCFAGESTYSPFGSRAREPERLVIHRLAQTNGFGGCVRSPGSDARIVQTSVLFQSPKRLYDGISPDETVRAGIS